ncbi:reverse transcriptase domain-containing protein [Tanacetum coccineum]|uniref:Reverse transcriptase domain-containing protein n=1 Tax=Tanacetum coccineum TaxID=301880 RepID=A0ABQ5H088_9ASTR
MADNRTMAQMLQAPIEGYEDAIVIPPINANNFELKQPLINLVQSNKFTGRQDPHNHLRFFNKVTSTFRHPEVPNTSVKLLLFPFSLDGEARDWLDKEPPRSILTWDDLVSKFINQYFPPSKTTYYRNEIITFYQKPNEAFNEAWERFKGLLRQLGQSAKTVHMLTKPQAFYDNIHKQALGYQNPFHLKKAQRIKPTLYDGIFISDKHVAMPVIDDEETLILEEKSRSKIKPSDALPVKIEAPKKLPKISLVNESLKSLNFTLPNGQCEFFENNNLKAQLQDKSKEENVNYDYCEIETKNVELENSVAKLLSENERLCNEINHVKQELLVYVQDMCPNAIKLSAKKVAITPKNNVKKVRIEVKVNKKNHVVGPICDDNVKHSKLNANSDLNCATCHPFTEVGFKWKPTGRTFTIAGNSCPLTRITSANVVPLKQTAFHSVETQKPELKVYNKKPKNVKNIGSSKKAKIVESKTANHSEPNPTWGSNATDIPSSSSLVMTVIPGLFH